VNRREFVMLLGGAVAAWPLGARAQQSNMSVIGYLGPGSAAASASTLAVFRQSLAGAGYVEGRNIAIEYRFAEGRYDRLREMAAELVRQQVRLIIATGGTAPALAAKAASATVPIVFSVTDDPVALGLVVSFARPGGNATCVNFPLAELAAKQLGLLHEFVPAARRIGLLVNPNNSPSAAVTKDVTVAASAMGVEICVVEADNNRAIETAFATLVHSRVEALLIGTDPFLFSRRVQLATLATRHAIPAGFAAREFPEVGGLMSYGASLTEVFRQLGVYVGRILNGAQPADLPVVRSVTFELVINMSTARALGLDVPPTLLARADEIIE
jgi:putative tryptophan/tyrosine transport system substrate-binding protein